MKVGQLDVYGIIYKITNKINGKVYIGQTIHPFHQRYKGSKWYEYTHNQHLKSSANKYGISNFEVNKCFDVAFSQTELDIKEKIWINYYKSNIHSYGYNSKSGGAKGKPNEESRRKMSENHWSTNKNISEMLRKNISKANKGKVISEEQKKKMRETFKIRGINTGRSGPLNSNYGKAMSDEQKLKISIANRGKKHSDETKERISKTKTEKGIGKGHDNNAAIVIYMYDLNMSLLQTFLTRKDCAEWLLNNRYVDTLPTGKYAISNAIRMSKPYKGLIFKKYTKQEYKMLQMSDMWGCSL